MSYVKTEKDIQEFDITTHIRSQVRGVILSSLPDDHIDSLIKSEYDSFFKSRRKYDKDIPSPFAKLVCTEIEEQMTKGIKEWFSENFEEVWDNDNMRQMVGELVKEFVPIAQARVMQDLTGRALSEIESRLRNPSY